MVRVLELDRAHGVHPSLLELLASWEREGSHDVVVAPNGGLRTDARLQAALASGGASAASTLRSTPHGRAAALDVWPVSFLAHVPRAQGGTASRWTSWEALPADVREAFAAFGRFAEVRGFVWGGRWRGKTFPHGDQPHVELREWRTMPFPPPVYLG